VANSSALEHTFFHDTLNDMATNTDDIFAVPSKGISMGSLSYSRVRPYRTDNNIDKKIVVVKCLGVYLEIHILINPHC